MLRKAREAIVKRAMSNMIKIGMVLILGFKSLTTIIKRKTNPMIEL
jgi:hypothetical protein